MQRVPIVSECGMLKVPMRLNKSRTNYFVIFFSCLVLFFIFIVRTASIGNVLWKKYIIKFRKSEVDRKLSHRYNQIQHICTQRRFEEDQHQLNALTLEIVVVIHCIYSQCFSLLLSFFHFLLFTKLYRQTFISIAHEHICQKNI